MLEELRTRAHRLGGWEKLNPNDFPIIYTDGSDIGNDQLVAVPEYGGTVPQEALSTELSSPRCPPQPRPDRRKGNVGRDVLAYKRALEKAGFRRYIPGRDDGIFGVHLEDQVKAFQHKHGLTADGVIGPHTYAALCPYFDAYSRWLLTHTHKLVSMSAQERIVQVALFGCREAASMHYYQQRPMQFMYCPPGIDAYLDCSEFATLCYKCSGAPDPNGFGFNGIGNTGTMLEHGRQVGTAEPGDIVFYGPGVVEHCAVAVNSSFAASMGNEAGPNLIDVWIPGVWHTIEIRRYV